MTHAVRVCLVFFFKNDVSFYNICSFRLAFRLRERAIELFMFKLLTHSERRVQTERQDIAECHCVFLKMVDEAKVKYICDIYDWDGKGEIDLFFLGDVMYALGLNITKKVSDQSEISIRGFNQSELSIRV